jgi:hypothetical protein
MATQGVLKFHSKLESFRLSAGIASRSHVAFTDVIEGSRIAAKEPVVDDDVRNEVEILSSPEFVRPHMF